MIIFVLYAFGGPREAGATGGIISNYLLLVDCAKYRNVFLIAPNISSDLLAELNSRGVRVSTKTFSPSGFRARLEKREWIRNELGKLLDSRSGRFHVIASTSTADIAFSICEQANVQFSVIVRAFEDFYFRFTRGLGVKGALKQLLLGVLYQKRVSKAYSSAVSIVVNSKFMASEVQQYFSTNRLVVVYPCIDMESASKGASTKPIRTIGIINPKKIKGEAIFLALAERYKNINFVYYGAVNKSYPASNISWLGWSGNRDAIFGSMDLLIVPSLWDEPFGRVSVEGIRSGIPVLVSRRGGLTETVDDKFVVRENSVDAWFEKVDWICSGQVDVHKAWERSLSLSKDFDSESHASNVKAMIAVFEGEADAAL